MTGDLAGKPRVNEYRFWKALTERKGILENF